jgi:hypothetical protein
MREMSRLMSLVVASVVALSLPSLVNAEPNSSALAKPVDPQTTAVLFGAAYATSELTPDHPMGMMFLPGRGLIRWETWGKTPAEQEELKTEAIGLADARAVQAEIDDRQAMIARQQQIAGDAMVEYARLSSATPARAASVLNLAALTGTAHQAGGLTPLNRGSLKAQLADTLGLSDGAHFKERGRFYIFGAVSGRGAGMNLLQDAGDGWINGGLSTDKGGFVGDRQVGIAFRRGRYNRYQGSPGNAEHHDHAND